ncbi:reverse transcriptase family protein [Citrobacter freundii]|uniref:reverse transcriptase family protein n=1 Tax=Citrobacter freundii TaxID=546 RepID=UPI00397A6114
MATDIPIKKPNTNSLRSLHSLSSCLDIPLSELATAKAMPAELRYKKKQVKKINGDFRDVYDPHPLIRRIQKRINNRIFKELILWPDFIYGSVPTNKEEKKAGVERHYIACAKKHCNAKTVLKVDIKNFFDNIHRDVVYDIFKRVFKFKGEVLNYLTDICCYDYKVVQGALTSSYIASLCLFDLEFDVVNRARRKQLIYTRLVDDITVSSKVVNYNMNQILEHIKGMLAEKDLPINEEKTQVHNISTESLKVHGLRISFNEPRLPSDEVGRIRASVYNLDKLSRKNNSITTVAYRIEYNRCVGRVNKLGRVNHTKYDALASKLKLIQPKAAKRDIDKVERAVSFLENSYKGGNSQKEYYKKKYDLAFFNLIILRRTPGFISIAEGFKNRLLKVKY